MAGLDPAIPKRNGSTGAIGIHAFAGTAISDFGKARPVATEDGKDYPEGRQKNRRVEVVFDTCK